MAKRPKLKRFPESEEHIEEVYSHYASRQPSPRFTRFALRACGVVLRPSVSHTDPDALEEYLDTNGRLVIAGNHHKGVDPFVFAGAVGFDPILRKIEEPIPRTRILAKKPLFLGPASPLFRPFIEHVGAIPVVRQRDNGTDLSRKSRKEIIGLSQNLVVDGAPVMLYPEETRRTTFTPQESKNGVGLIAVGAATMLKEAGDSGPVRVLPIAVDYEGGIGVFNAHVRTGELIEVDPDHSVDHVHAQTMVAIGKALEEIQEAA